MNDPVNHPPHYTHLGINCFCGLSIECICVTENFNFNKGNIIKYVWRSSHKGKEIEDLKKARFYLDREILKLERMEAVKHEEIS